MKSAARSAIIIVGAFVLPETSAGITEQSAKGCDLLPPCALLAGPVEIICCRCSGSAGRSDPPLTDRMWRGRVCHDQLARLSMTGVRQSLVAFLSLEARQDILETPTRAAVNICPMIIVTVLSAHLDHAIDRRPAPDNHIVDLMGLVHRGSHSPLGYFDASPAQKPRKGSDRKPGPLRSSILHLPYIAIAS